MKWTITCWVTATVIAVGLNVTIVVGFGLGPEVGAPLGFLIGMPLGVAGVFIGMTLDDAARR